MAETTTITVAETSTGVGASGTSGDPISLPVVELLTGRGFITGKSGSGKSNSASVIAEKLLDNGFGLLIVDIDGEYYGLKEEYEILHAGGDEECDIQVTTEHAEKLASLALEQNVPIILDVSSYLDEAEAEELLTAVSRSLFAKAKKQKQPFLMLVEEVHEYIPENGSVGECGKMLIKIGKRGRKHGLGICGISQRPADVKKDYITQCDWLLWHRLTWNNDTKVVRRILDGEYASAVEDLDDGEGFLMTDWSERVRRVQFHRKQTFDAGATPGLDDFERPDLKSVSSDLVSELEEISEEERAKEDRIAELREELDRKNSQIAELEKELQDARDLSRMADQFVTALLQHVDGAAPGKTERERMRESASEGTAMTVTEATAGGDSDDHDDEPAPSASTDDDVFAALADVAAADAHAAAADSRDSDESTPTEPDETAQTASPFSADEVLSKLNAAPNGPEQPIPGDYEIDTDADPTAEQSTDGTNGRDRTNGHDDSGGSILSLAPEDADASENASEEASSSSREPPAYVRELKSELAGLDTKTRMMLRFYRDHGPATPFNAHFAVGGDGDRTRAYAHNRDLRTSGVIEHVGRGHYEYCLEKTLREELDGVTEAAIDVYVESIETTVMADLP